MEHRNNIQVQQAIDIGMRLGYLLKFSVSGKRIHCDDCASNVYLIQHVNMVIVVCSDDDAEVYWIETPDGKKGTAVTYLDKAALSDN